MSLVKNFDDKFRCLLHVKPERDEANVYELEHGSDMDGARKFDESLIS
jgi:hypothetical protein